MSMAQQEVGQQHAAGGLLAQFSDEIAEVVARVRPSIVRIDDGTRLASTGIVWPSEAGGEDAIVAATSHGVEDDTVLVESADGARRQASVIGRDAESDIAVLRVAGAGGQLAPAQLAPPASVAVGQLALAMGQLGAAGMQATLGEEDE